MRVRYCDRSFINDRICSNILLNTWVSVDSIALFSISYGTYQLQRTQLTHTFTLSTLTHLHRTVYIERWASVVKFCKKYWRGRYCELSLKFPTSNTLLRIQHIPTMEYVFSYHNYWIRLIWNWWLLHFNFIGRHEIYMSYICRLWLKVISMNMVGVQLKHKLTQVCLI